MNGIGEFIKTLGPARLLAMGAVTIALVGFFAFVMTRMTAPNMVPLFTDLALNDSAAVIRDLDSQGIRYDLRQDGAVIMVPSEVVARTRMRLAEAGVPSGGAVGYEIFDKGDSLSSTSFLQNVNRMRALEGELARSIRAINRVSAARVHLVIPERPLFRRDAPEPSASIVVRVAGTLGGEQIRAIRHLVASAVPGLRTERISLVDEGGRLLAGGDGEEDPFLHGAGEERLVAFERRLKERIEGIVERVVGPDRARAEVRAEIDTSRVTQTSDNFDPESRVARSTQLREETNESTEQRDGVTVANELPNAEPTAASPNQENSSKSEEITNYEISRVTRTEVQEAGRVKRLSVAVLVDGVYDTAADGSAIYTPRAQEELDRIAALVRTAMGYDQSRGDQIEVVNLRFAEQPMAGIPIADEGGIIFGLEKSDLFRIGEMIVLAILSMLVLFMVVRPLVRSMLAPSSPEKPQIAMDEAAAGMALPGPGDIQISDDGPMVVHSSQAARMVEMAQVSGKIRAQALEQVGQLVERNPNETVAIIRQWLNEPA